MKAVLMCLGFMGKKQNDALGILGSTLFCSISWYGIILRDNISYDFISCK